MKYEVTIWEDWGFIGMHKQLVFPVELELDDLEEARSFVSKAFSSVVTKQYYKESAYGTEKEKNMADDIGRLLGVKLWKIMQDQGKSYISHYDSVTVLKELPEENKEYTFRVDFKITDCTRCPFHVCVDDSDYGQYEYCNYLKFLGKDDFEPCPIGIKQQKV